MPITETKPDMFCWFCLWEPLEDFSLLIYLNTSAVPHKNAMHPYTELLLIRTLSCAIFFIYFSEHVIRLSLPLHEDAYGASLSVSTRNTDCLCSCHDTKASVPLSLTDVFWLLSLGFMEKKLSPMVCLLTLSMICRSVNAITNASNWQMNFTQQWIHNQPNNM